MQGRIIKGIAGFYYVYDVVESVIYECKAKGIFRREKIKPLVGDLVEYEILDAEEKTGNIIGVKAVNQDNEIMLITTEGIIIRIPVNGTALLGRVTSGVKLINVNDGVTVASMARVKEDKSIMENDIPEPEQPEGVIVEEDEDASASEEELISKELGELINRAEQDSEEE